MGGLCFGITICGLKLGAIFLIVSIALLLASRNVQFNPLSDENAMRDEVDITFFD